MEFASSERVDVYITVDDSGPDSEELERSCKSEKKLNSVLKFEPTVFVTQLPNGVVQAKDLKIQVPSKELSSDLLYRQLKNDVKASSIVTIHVPVDGISPQESEDDMQINIEVGEKGLLENNKFPKNMSKLKDGDVIVTSGDKYIINSGVLPKIRPNRVPIWKRHTPNPPGFISNYLYPHVNRNVRSRLIIDCPTNIPVPEFKAQLADTSDIVTTLDVAPSTKRKIRELTTNGVSKLFAYPGKPLPCKRLLYLFQRHLTSQRENHTNPDDLDLQPIGYTPNIDYSQVKRISRKRKLNEGEGSDNSEPAAGDIVQAMVPISDQVVRVLIKPGVIGDEEQEILVLHDGSDKDDFDGSTSSLQHSIEVLLAAAESGEIGKSTEMEQIYICDDGTYMEGNQIIILQQEDEEIST
jgi:hypothetical protein